MRKNYFKYFISLAMMALFLMAPFAALAADNDAANSLKSGGVTISPPIREFTASPGSQYQETIKLSNPSSNIVELYPLTMDFTAEGETGQPKFSAADADSNTYSLAKWVSFTQSKIALAPQQVLDFVYNINVPANAEAGGHYGVVFFSTQPPQISSNSSQVSISSMIGCLLLITVQGDINESLNISSFDLPRIVFSNKLEIKTRLSNTGNVHQKPIGEILVQSELTHASSVITFNSERGNVLPSTSRLFSNSWTGNIFKNIGPHRIQLNLTYGNKNHSLNDTAVVWLLPRWLIITVVSLVLVIVLMIIIISRRKRKDFNKFFKVPK